MTPDVAEAADIMEKSLSAWPSAPGARTEMLRRLFTETQQAYLIDLVPGQRDNSELMNTMALKEHQMSWFTTELPVQNLDACLIWLEKAKDHEHNVERPWRLLTAAQIYAMKQNVKSMLDNLKMWLDTAPTIPSDDDTLVLLSAVHVKSDWEKLQALWDQRFSSSPLNVDPQQALSDIRDSHDQRMHIWLVVSQNPTLPTRVVDHIALSINRHSGWSVTTYLNNSEDTSEEFGTDESLLAAIDKRWILLRPVPRFPG